jgi:inosine-uridine nucleoside N-ribohydrolase
MTAGRERARPPRPVWIDTDPAVGQPGADVDDGFAILQALGSPELRIVGLSTVFGNTSRPAADRIAAELLALAGAGELPVHSGADNAAQLGRPTAASHALCAALEREPLTVLALGPLTNLATVLATRPELAARITQLVFVGGRRPAQRFTIAGQGPLPDFNVESDPAACERILATEIPLLLAGFEVATHATITGEHLDRLTHGPPAARWLAERSRDWLAWWAEQLDHDGFHPFDTLAVAAVAAPELIELAPAAATIMRIEAAPPGDLQLHARLGATDGRIASYATRAASGFVEDLMRRLLGRRDD